VKTRCGQRVIQERPGLATVLLAMIWCLTLSGVALAQEPAATAFPTSYTVKYLVPDAVYLDGGTTSGLSVGMKLSVQRKDAAGPNRLFVAELEVVAVTSISAVCSVTRKEKDLVQGDTAYLSASDIEARDLEVSDESTQYLMVASFSEGDPIDEELREYVPRPPLPEINRVRGRIGVDYGGLAGLHSGGGSSRVGLLLRADVTRIGGTHWRFNGYHRGRLDSRRSRRNETLTDVLNRTYQLSFSYDNPESPWVLGLGRLHVPWASSLNVVDGGFAGRRFGRGMTVGLFGGSSPDPTSWRYAPDRQLSGAFFNLERGSFQSVRHSSTVGVALDYRNWNPDRRFGFLENSVFYKHFASVYHSLEVDKLRRDGEQTGGVVPSRSFLTVRMQPSSRVSFDISHNYFREVPTFDSRLVGTGLVDKLLFQGVSGGVRLQLPRRVSPYVSVGRSSRNDDGSDSWNVMYGVFLGEVWKGLRLDARRSRFDSAFGEGTYTALDVTRELNERIRIDLQGGLQRVHSAGGVSNRARWMTLYVDWLLTEYFIGAGLTFYRGNGQDYNQWAVTGGYRFGSNGSPTRTGRVP